MQLVVYDVTQTSEKGVPLGAAVAVAALLAAAVDDEERVALGDGGNSEEELVDDDERVALGDGGNFEGEVEALAEPVGDVDPAAVPLGEAVSLALWESLGVAVGGGDARGDKEAEGDEDGEGGGDAEWEALPLARVRDAVAQSVARKDAGRLGEGGREEPCASTLSSGLTVGGFDVVASALAKSRRLWAARGGAHVSGAGAPCAVKGVNPEAARKKITR